MSEKFVTLTLRINPSWVKDEAVWEKAKAQALKEHKETDEGFYAIVATIYKDMGGEVRATKANAEHFVVLGGPGSGNFGHAGRPGLVGGSESVSGVRAGTEAESILYGIKQGKDNKTILAEVKKDFPDSKINYHRVAWYRSHVRTGKIDIDKELSHLQGQPPQPAPKPKAPTPPQPQPPQPQPPQPKSPEPPVTPQEHSLGPALGFAPSVPPDDPLWGRPEDWDTDVSNEARPVAAWKLKMERISFRVSSIVAKTGLIPESTGQIMLGVHTGDKFAGAQALRAAKMLVQQADYLKTFPGLARYFANDGKYTKLVSTIGLSQGRNLQTGKDAKIDPRFARGYGRYGGYHEHYTRKVWASLGHSADWDDTKQEVGLDTGRNNIDYTARGILRHELGHAVHSVNVNFWSDFQNALLANGSGENDTRVGHLNQKRLTLRGKRAFADQVSTYSTSKKDMRETFAECFNAYTAPWYGNDGRKLPGFVEAVFDKHLKNANP